MSSQYHLPNIRALLMQGFDESQLRRLCYDHFRPVSGRLAQNMSQAEITDELIEYAERTIQLDELLALAKAENPARYKFHQPYYDRAGIEAELAKVEQGLVAQESLRGVLPDEQVEAILAQLQEKQAALEARLSQAGASARGEQAAAIRQGDQGQAIVGSRIGGDVIGPGVKTTGERGVIAEQIQGPLATGQAGRAVQAGTYIEKQELQTAPPAASRARERYLRRLRQRCNVLPLATLGGDEETGAEISLDQVYVALNTRTRIPLSKKEKAKRRSDFLDRAEDRPLTALEAATQARRLALLGDPGSGKSTFVFQLAAWLAAAQLGEEKAPAGWQAVWPLALSLRDLGARLAPVELAGRSEDEQSRALVEAVREQWRAELKDLGAPEAAEMLEDTLTEGEVLLIFDGLDEVAESVRRRVRQAVQAVLKTYPAVERVIVTCRIRSYSGAAVLPGFTPHTLAAFDTAQIRQFIQAWYQAQASLGRLRPDQADRNAGDLQRAALAEELRELAANPMLLTSMALIHQREVGLPRERVRLYSLAVQVLLSRWQKRKGVFVSDRLAGVLSDDLKLRLILERLGYEAHQLQGQQGPAADLSRRDILALLEDPRYLGEIGLAAEFLDYVDQRAGLLVGRGGDEAGRQAQTYNFPHRTFQEYLAGCYMVAGRGAAREYWRRVAAGDYWYLAGQLGAEELLYNRRNLETGLDLAYALCPVPEPKSETGWRAALWSGQMATHLGLETIGRDTGRPDGGRAYLERLVPRLVRILEGDDLGAIERATAGAALAQLGDPRAGVTTPDQMEFCLVPAGPFWMGSEEDEDEQPLHQVDLPYDYWLARYPVTNAQYRAFVEDGGYQEAGYWAEAIAAGRWQEGQARRFTLDIEGNISDEWAEEPYDYGRPYHLANHPVVGVSWYEALAFCRWLTDRWRDQGRLPSGWQVSLPSEAEWEKAARGGLDIPARPVVTQLGAVQAATLIPNPEPQRRYPWGDEADPNRANYAETGSGQTSAAGCFSGGASPYGCLDMSGNVWEWTRSLWRKGFGKPDFKYPYDPADGREDLEAGDDILRVLRGGSFYLNELLVRCAVRYWYRPGGRFRNFGFRVVGVGVGGTAI